jgi:uncharacterized protein
MVDTAPELAFVLKVASRCNLNCSYCYVYNKGDTSWRTRPAFIADAVLGQTIYRIRRHLQHSGQRSVRITFHGGEPLLAGPDRFGQWCARLQRELGDIARVIFTLQTNATLINERWIEVFERYDIDVGVSMDGPPRIHDAERVDHRGRPSYLRVAHGIALLQAAGRPVNVLAVIPFGADPLEVHEHFVSIGVSSINYLLPDFTHDTIEPVWAKWGPHPCADFLIPVFDAWYDSGELRPKITLLWNVGRVILGGESRLDLVGNGRFSYVFVEADGAIEGLDVLRVCDDDAQETGCHVAHHDFMDIARRSVLHRDAMFDGIALPTACVGCREQTTCAGGYLPHRFSRVRGFDNASVWCADLLLIFDHVRRRFGVSVEETAARRTLLSGGPTDTPRVPSAPVESVC